MIDFTKMELQVLKLIAKGLMLNEIISVLDISRHTAKKNIESIYKKLNVKNRVQAVVKAILYGIIKV